MARALRAAFGSFDQSDDICNRTLTGIQRRNMPRSGASLCGGEEEAPLRSFVAQGPGSLPLRCAPFQASGKGLQDYRAILVWIALECRSRRPG
jgi:hypothetical protein